MSRRYLVLHIVWLVITITTAVLLVEWTWAAFDYSRENMDKPFRGLFRLVFSAFIVVLATGTQAMIARRVSL